MLTDPKILGKMEKIEERYEALRFRVVAKVQAQYAETTEHFRQEPILPYKPARRGMAWGGDGITCWFCGEVAVPRGLAGKPLFLRAGTNAETLLFVNGNPRGVFDANHPVVRITHGAPAGKRIRVALEAYAGHYVPGTQPGETRPAIEKGCKTFEGLELLLERPEVSRFVFDLRTLRQIANCLDEHSLRKGRILGGLKAVFAAVQAMPDPEDEEAWLPGIREALGIMAPLLALENGPTTPVFGIFGHSHIDTAWQWTIAETWRKCARTFSSVLNLMDQYPQFIFMQSAPYPAERMRDLYPAVFEGMRMKAEAGQWEPNGAMYIEPDCNIPAGESFVRQLLVGQRTQLELFGTYSDTLWLPDVFGYSAALPQLLRQARVRYFCTSKLSWNDTNRFPYDTFLWKGIDGTAVVSHFHRIHCWPDPETLTEFWNLVQHPDAQDRMLCPFGYGDGGGGPMAEMIEMGERARDVEGCPRAEFTTLSDFMAGIERGLGAELPVHSGELYLELHRGTLTSVAEIKRGNRVLEQELLALEKLAAYAGADLRAELAPVWKEFLVLQFHDILPGSSMARVNDEALEAFARLTALVRDLQRRMMAELAGAGQGVALFNTLSWPFAGQAFVPGLETGLAGADCQPVERLTGERGMAVQVRLPGEGGASFSPGPVAEKPSPFSVEGDLVVTPFAEVRFDDAGAIASFKDRTSGRELVAPGGVLNALYLGEDVPAAWDNWDIDRDQELKLRRVGVLLRREVAAEGPLQLRIRSTYGLSDRSTLEQDVVFYADTPRVDFESVLHWHDKHQLLKVAFPLNLLADSARHEIQYGHVERPTHENLFQDRARFEVCAHRFTDLSELDFGVALLNDCKYGVGVRGGELRLTLVKSGIRPDPRGDEGDHRFTYALLPHGPFAVQNVVRAGYELNRPPHAYLGAGVLEPFSLAELDAPNTILEAVKRPEEGEGLILRIYEAGKCATRTRLRLPGMIWAWRVNLLEEEQEELAVTDGTVELALHPFEVTSLRVLRQGEQPATDGEG